MSRTAAAVFALVAPVAAAAGTQVATAVPPPESPPAFDGRLGFLVGGDDVGNVEGTSLGVSAAAGYRRDDVTLRALFDYYRVGDDLDRRGRATRLGGAVRYSFAHTSYDSRFAADFWGELGAGWEHVAWIGGGVLDRPSAEGAFGFDLGVRGDHAGHRRAIGYFMAFRTLVGRSPEDPSAMATCVAACTQATRPPRTDITMFYELGVHWGR
jgi:hypothetical protein